MDKKLKRTEPVNFEQVNYDMLCRIKSMTECCVCRTHISGMLVQALGKNWHPHHFVCYKCKEPISASKFNLFNGSPYCEKDYAQLFTKKCYGCKQSIQEFIVVANDQCWHVEHFICCGCGTKLGNQPYYEKEENAFCTSCYEENFCPICSFCREPVIDIGILALGCCWHQECFKCNNCNETITDASFELYKKKAVCADCAKVLKILKIDTTAF